MEKHGLIQELKDHFSEGILDVMHPANKRVIFTINPDYILQVSKFLYEVKKLRFIIASALHTKKGYEILYHFSDDKAGLIINIHVVLTQDKPEIRSLTGLFSAAEWIEREMYELLGINFQGHPNLVKLISKDNWPEGTYPYRKDFKA
jgi:NADH-quinone oxidoreductase subunit C